MSSRTPRFGLTTLDESDDPGAITGPFGTTNRWLLDQLIASVIEDHEHSGAGLPIQPVSALPLQVQDTGGVFPANRMIFYRFGFVDERGHEHVASQQASVITANPIAAPLAPALEASPGPSVLQPGEYIYRISAYTFDTGNETEASRGTFGTLPEGRAWVVKFPALPAGASGWNVYRKGPTDLEAVFVTSIAEADVPEVDGVRFFLDDGQTPPNIYRPAPQENTTSATSSVVIGTGVLMPLGATIKIYRTFNQSDWADSLVARVATFPYTDTGHATQPGAPLAGSLAFGGAPKIRFGTDTEGTLPPGRITSTRFARFNVAGAVEAGISPWQWVNEYTEVRMTAIRANLSQGSSPAVQAVKVGVDVNRGSGWEPLLNDAAARVEASIPVGKQIGEPTTITSGSANPVLTPGNAVRLVVLQSGGGAPPTDADLSVAVTLAVRHGSDATSYTWEED